MAKAQIIITLTEQGKVDVNGPLQDKVFCYGLLEIARQVVQNYQPPKLVVPSFIPPKDLKGN